MNSTDETAAGRIDQDPMWYRAYMDVQKALDETLGTEEEDGSDGGIAADVYLLARQRDEARAARDDYAARLRATDQGWATVAAERDESRAELARVQSAAQTLGRVVTWQARSMEAARIEMLQNGPEKAMQWILNSIPDVDDNDPEDQWDGKESAAEWIDRVQAADRAAVEAGRTQREESL